MLIWLHTPPTTLPAAKLAELTEEELERAKVQALIEKRTLINVVQGLSVAVKHYLREESG